MFTRLPIAVRTTFFCGMAGVLLSWATDLAGEETTGGSQTGASQTGASQTGGRKAGDWKAGDWKTGVELQRARQGMVGVHWENVPLRQALDGLAQQQQVAVFLDRRMDPDQRIDFAPPGQLPFDELLRGLSATRGATVAVVGPVLYVGPSADTGKLATVVELQQQRAAGCPPEVARRLATRRSLGWEMLAEPRDLITSLAGEYDVRVENPELIPHDVWAAAEWPPLDFSEAMTLLLSGFQLTYRLADDGASLRFMPIPAQVALERSVPGTVRAQWDKVAAQFPEVEAREAGEQLVLRGRYEDLERALAALRGSTSRSARPVPRSGRTGYSLEVENQPVGAVLKTLQQKVGLEMRIADDAAPRLYQRVTFALKEASLDEVLRQALGPAGLDFRRDGDVVEVFRKP